MSAGAGHLVERAVERMAELAQAARALPSPPERPAVPLVSRPLQPEPASAGGAPVPASAAAAGSAKAVAGPVLSLAAMEAAGMAVAGTRRSRVAEEWGITSGALLRALQAPRPVVAGRRPAANLLMITSSKPNEGKSFSALNLAGSLTVSGLAEVLLLDIDSKPGALSETLGLDGRPGLFDLVADAALRPEDLVLQTAIKGLAVLPIGRAARDGPGSAERTVSRAVLAVIEQLAQHFANRVLILDTAPCLATSDASSLAPMVSQIAMIVEAERTQRDDLEAALELLRACPHVILILNKVRQVTTHAFGDDHYYGG